ncbi:MAG: YibE/F family protein [Turicibacter sp.]|nr:YibE/F family protein [Turicibacter sp.]
MKLMNKWLLSGVLLLMYLMAILYANRPMAGDLLSVTRAPTETATIVAVHPTENRWQVNLDLHMGSGPWSGVVLAGVFRPNELYDIMPRPGDRFAVEVRPVADNALPHVEAIHPERQSPLLLFMGLFAGALLLIGGKKGLRSLASLGFTLSSIFLLLVPLMVRGYPVIASTLLVVVLMTVTTVVIIGGSWPKMLTAILGTLIGVLFALGVSQVFSQMAHIHGLQREEASHILATTAITETQARDLFTSGILIASLGAVLDTAMSIASALEEIRATKSRISPVNLLRSGMNVGRDAMGTMSNTLILAFVGASLNLVILEATADTSLHRLLNDRYIAMEILRSISGSFGIVFSVPAVSFIGALLLGSTPKKVAASPKKNKGLV